MRYIHKQARFSRCKRYRYSLTRRWTQGQGKVLFIGLNPSTADGESDDPTIRRCVGFARDWGFAALEVVNLFAWRATYPADLKAARDPVGPRNDYWIRRCHRQAQLTIACWGNHGAFRSRASAVIARLDQVHCIKMNQSMQPAHPLYLPARSRPAPMPMRT